MDMQKIVSGLQIASTSVDPWHPIGGTDSPWDSSAWVPTGSANSTPAYRKLPNNLLALKGDVTFTATASLGIGNPQSILTLPSNYSPAESQSVPATYYTVSGSSPTIAGGRVPLLQIATSGVVTVFNMSLAATAGNVIRMQLNC